MSDTIRNILLIIGEVIICYVALIVLLKKYKTDGIYVYTIIATFISCIMSLKQIAIMNISVPIGFGVTTSLIIVSNIITQKRGPEEIKTLLLLITATSLVSCCFLNLSGMMASSDYNKFANMSYDSIFAYNIKMYLALSISVVLSSWLGSKLYYTLKKLQNKIIISNIFSIIIIEFIETFVFVLIAYIGNYQVVDIALCIILRYIIKAIIGLLGTIPIYIECKNN